MGNINDERQSIARALHELADDIGLARMPSPGSVHVYVSWRREEMTQWDEYGNDYQDTGYGDAMTADDAREAMRGAPGNWEKRINGDRVLYVKSYGDDVEFTINVQRTDQCERVQVGERHVPAVPAHNEPVYEWRCAPEPNSIEAQIEHDELFGGPELRAAEKFEQDNPVES